MQSVILTKYGAPEVLKVKELKDVEPDSNEVRIKVHYAGINFAEIMARMKLYPGGPKPGGILGGEVSGVIDKVGDNVEDLNIGDKVMGLTLNGSYTSQTCINADSIIPLPDNFKLDEAAAFPVTYITAYMMMFDLGNLQDGDTFLIHGAGGGVGTAAIQLAKTKNIKIIGTSSSWKHDKLIKMGVDKCVDYNKSNTEKEIMDFTDGKGVDLIIDPVGAKNWKLSYKVLSKMGKLIIYGDQNLVKGDKLKPLVALKEIYSMPKYRPMDLMANNKAVMGYHLGRFKGHEWKVKRSISNLIKLVQNHDLHPVVDSKFPYHDASKAHRYIQDRKNFGKVLLDFTSIK
ncbi:MAG: alcohol dehydrogenase [Candidatus Marinimicrobia bacterium]|nr:alcohol dehydrogenase [Candidatus Neomarinimicrobiota bacterium]|tara:strand:- start:14 stop:1042 length:1029 start_codon:yes stop_codon:yes gene_type:complete